MPFRSCVVCIEEKFGAFSAQWSQKIVGQVNSDYVKLIKMQGEFFWHRHDDADELFVITKGTLKMHLRDRVLELKEGQMAIMPKGVEHKPIAEQEVWVICIEPKDISVTWGADEKGDLKPMPMAWLDDENK